MLHCTTKYIYKYIFSYCTSLNKLNTFVLELRVFVLNNFKAINLLFFCGTVRIRITMRETQQ